MMKKLLFAMLAAIMAIGVSATEIPIYGDVALSDYYAMFDGSGAIPDNNSYEGRANYWFKYNSNLSIAMICWVEGFSASPIQGNTLTLPTTVTIDGKSHKVVGIFKPGSGNIFRTGAQGITTLNIPEGYEFIYGDYALNLEALTSLKLPASLKWISVWALDKCTAVKTLTLADNATTPLHVEGYKSYGAGLCSSMPLTTVTIGRNIECDGAFFSYSNFPCAANLKNVTITGAVRTLPEYLFYDMPKLNNLTIHEGLTAISKGAFEYCTALTSVTIPGSVKSIADYAFRYDGELVTLNLGNGVQHIGENAFRDCKKVTSLTLPASLQSINVWAFQDMTGVKTLTVEDSATPLWVQHYRAHQQGLFTDFAEGFTCYMGRNFDLHADDDAGVSLADPPLRASKVGKVTMSDRVTALNIYEFENCKLLTTVTPSKNITEIPERAFYNNEKLTGFAVPDKVTAIGVQAFAYDTSMVALDLGKGVKTIAESAFRDCKKVTALTLPASLQSINVLAFQGMTGVKTLTIEDSAAPLWVQNYRGFQQGLFTDFVEGFTCYMGRNFDLHADDDAGVSLADPPLRASKVGELTLGIAVGPLNDSEFENCKKLTKITSAATTVPTCPSANVFYNVDKNIPVYVPKNSIAAYRAAIGWELFYNIQKIVKRGDINGDDTVDIADINILINAMLGKAGQQFDGGDLNGDGTVDIADINAAINIMLGK